MTGGKGMFYLQYDLPQLVRFAEDKLRVNVGKKMHKRGG